ncbi:MAG: M1 family metallopeptidase [Acidobacteria bacterium]|nr:M1 family metallopeptidase [Acidobacteriota bacterium]
MARPSALAAALLAAACSAPPPKPAKPMVRDVHSHSNPHQVRMTHLDLDLDVRFDRKILEGSATLTLDRLDPTAPLILDTRALDIRKAEAAPATGDSFEATPHKLGTPDPNLGAPLTIDLPPNARRVRIHYATSPEASGLQWLDPPQTAGKKHPFLFTQSQAIHARSWIPLQDSPGVRITYRGRIRTPRELIALMSARRDFRLANPKEPPSGDYTFRMPHRIPSYLIALAAGHLDSRYLSTRSEVWAEPSVVESAQKEFADTERMTQAVEKLYGPYQWLRYDLLVLPPSFPFGGMENPIVTFATPTILAGDQSLVSLIAHELAHSWSGNLVTNATWSDFWLNEGFTVYVERRVLEALYGPARAAMESVLGYRELKDELARLPEKDQILHIDLDGRDPDDGVTTVPYEKGALFLRALEDAFGRERFDAFVRAYFAHFRFESITTATFRTFLEKNLLALDPAAAAKVPVEEWITKPGLPASAPVPVSDAFQPVEALAAQWKTGTPAGAAPKDWTTHHWLHFLRAFPPDTPASKLAQLDQAYRFTQSGNAEITGQWLIMAVRAGYQPAFAKLERFLISVGRRKFLKPIYEELVKTPAGRGRAAAIFAKARAGYHPIATSTIEGIIARPR